MAVLGIGLLLAGCGKPKDMIDDGSMDLAAAADLRADPGTADLRSPAGDLAGADLASSADMMSPPDLAMVGDMGSVCSSGRLWVLGDIGNAAMHPGKPCISCHKMRKGPTLTLAGTVYPTAHEPDDCAGPSGAVVEVTDAAGKVISMPTNNNGNFRYSTAFTPPYTAKVTYMGRTRSMSSSQTNGDCNACHTVNGDNGAPGRIMLP